MFVGIKEGSRLIGITPRELRMGLREGRYPFIVRGGAYLVNPEMILIELDNEAEKNRQEILNKKKELVDCET